MENILIEKSHRNPAVNFNAKAGVLEINGRSIIENTHAFYAPLIIDWLDKYLENPKDLTTVNIAFEYYNTSSQMWIFRMLKRLTVLSSIGKRFIINWFYFDEDIKEAGEDFQSLLKTQFNIIEAQD